MLAISISFIAVHSFYFQLTGLPSPGPIQFTLVMPYSVSLCWGLSEGLTSLPQFKVTCSCRNKVIPQKMPQTRQLRGGRRRYVATAEEDMNCPISKATLPLCMIVQCLEACFEGLVPDTQYDFVVTTLNETGIESERVFATTRTGKVQQRLISILNMVEEKQILT